MGLFKKIGKGIGKVAKGIGKGIGKVVKNATGDKGIITAAGQALTGKPLKAIGTVFKGIGSTVRNISRKNESKDKPMLGDKITNSFNRVLGGVSGGVTFGADQKKAYIPIIIAVGAMVFLVFAFGGLFRKSKRRR